MDEYLNKGKEFLEQGKNRTHEQAVAGTGDYKKAEQLKTQHKTEENVHAAGHRISETVNRAADKVTNMFEPKKTPGQKLDSALDNTTL